jgi:hypothetical protein
LAISEVIAHVDAEILKLQQVRAMLLGGSTPAPKAGRGRPKGSKNATTIAAAAAPVSAKSKRKLSPEGRKAIADAMKLRWAERRKTAAK